VAENSKPPREECDVNKIYITSRPDAIAYAHMGIPLPHFDSVDLQNLKYKVELNILIGRHQYDVEWAEIEVRTRIASRTGDAIW